MPDETNPVPIDPISEKENYEMLMRSQGQAMPAEPLGYGISRRVSVRAQMEFQLKELEQRSNEIKKLIKLFDENKSIEEILNTMRRLGIG